MDKKITIFVVLLFSLVFPQSLFAKEVNAYNPDPIRVDQVVTRKLDREALILQEYLAKFNSPMQYHAQDFIDAAKTYNLDWKMLPAIAGVESTFGKHIPGGYNAYGWGVYGTQAIYFTSWTDGIFTVAKGLREGYLNKGLLEPYAINKVYAASPHWGKNVTFFMNDLEKFAMQYEKDNFEQNELTKTSEPKIAAVSATLAFREIGSIEPSAPVIR